MKSPMWETVGRIVIEFIKRDKHWHALAAWVLFLTMVGATIAIGTMVGSAGVSAVTKQIAGR